MSDQPKPTTDEWTAVTVQNFFAAHRGQGPWSRSTYDYACGLLAEKINAALTESWKDGFLKDKSDMLEAAIAAEREKSDNLFSISRKYCVENRRLRKIISSNETSLGVCVREQKQEIQQLREQRDESIRLLECKEKQLAGVETMQRGYMARITELAAARQPLVDALENVSADLRGLGMAIPDVCDAIRVIDRKIDAALAKVKEK